MKICLAQTEPITGNITQNINRHLEFVAKAFAYQADFIIFPELSLTGYEPTLAISLAIQPNHANLAVFQTEADAKGMTICVGAPTLGNPLPGISLLIFQPQQPLQVYTKQYLHADEVPFFAAGPHSAGKIGSKNDLALAICYELSVPEHAEAAANSGAQIYVASVAKVAQGIVAAHGRLAKIAKSYQMTTLMVNCVGIADGERCAGQSAVWNHQGRCVAQLDNNHEGLLVFDIKTEEVLIIQDLRRLDQF